MPIMAMILVGGDIRSEIIAGQMVSWTDFSHITCIAAGSEYIYLGSTEGILRYNRFENRWAEPITVSDGLPGQIVQRIAVPYDDAWITVETENGIYTRQFQDGYWYLETEFPSAFEQDSRPVFPLPDLFMPFGYRIGQKGIVSDNLFREWSVTAWLNDQRQSIFIGTWGLNVLKADSRDLSAELIPCGLLQKRTDAIYIDGDSIWLAGNRGLYADQAGMRFGVTLFDLSNQKFTYLEPRFIPGFDSEIIYDIAADEKNVYFAGRQGLTVLSRKDGGYFTLNRSDGLPDQETTALAIGRDSVWIGTGRGLALYDPEVDTIQIISRNVFGDLFITDLLLAGSRLFVGTDQGVLYIDSRSKMIGRLREPESKHLSDSAGDPFSILEGEIRDLFEYNRRLLVASDRGLIIIDLNTEKIEGEVQIIEPVYACVCNDKYVAAAVDDALLLIDRETGKRRRFTKADGLISTKINAIIVDGDFIWLGSEEGLTRFKWINPRRVD